MFKACQDLGVGVGLRPPHYPIFRNKTPDSVSFIEVISENFMNWHNHKITRPIQMLEQVRQDLPVIFHGVSMSIGSADDLNQDYLRELKNLIQKIQPAWISDHLCWTGVDNKNLHDLLPLPLTQGVLKHVTDKVRRVQDYLGQQILIENPSTYIEFKASDMTEWEFLKELCEKADCGLLLDVNNVYVNSVNHGFDPVEYLKSIPVSRIGQIHLAGHSNQGDYLIDTHDAPVCSEVWELFEWTTKNLGFFSTMIERDGNIPEWEVLEQEVLKIHSIRNN
ncbi:MAG: DUF692 domain-containing protein [Deltaproteobacteria bacterium]|nr:DUF692 domain-containing protein [Deltaproteobacteria bacterium]